MARPINPNILDLEQLSETYNHFLPHIIRTLEKEGAFKYSKGDSESKAPFSSEPKIDMEELKKYQVVFTSKVDGFFSKAWKKFWARNDEEDGTYRVQIIKILTDTVYEDE
jgi:hypothetical protein